MQLVYLRLFCFYLNDEFMTTIRFYHRFLIVLTALFLLGGCNDSSKEIPDISSIDVDGTFSSDGLFIFDPTLGPKNFTKISTEHQAFAQIFLHNILFPGDTTKQDAHFLSLIEQMAKDTTIKNLTDTLHLAFDDELADIQTKYKTAFKYLKYYFPDYQTPNVYLCNTLFNYQKFIFAEEDGRDGLGIGGEMFLNDFYDYKMIDPSNPSFSDYLTRSFNRDHLVKKSLDLVVDELVGAPMGNRMLDQMVRNGKKLYILEKLLPYSADSVILEYTQDQVDWCKANELEIWGFFIDQNLFYETSPVKTAKYLNDSPNAPGMPIEAPGRTANYIGLQIVKKYMESDDVLTLDALIENKDAQKILDSSGYKPKRK